MTKNIPYTLGTLVILMTFHPCAYALDAINNRTDLSDYAKLSFPSNTTNIAAISCVRDTNTGVCYTCGANPSCGSLSCTSIKNVSAGSYEMINSPYREPLAENSFLVCLGTAFCMAPRHTLVTPETADKPYEKTLVHNYQPEDSRHCYTALHTHMCNPSDVQTTPVIVNNYPYCKCSLVISTTLMNNPCALCEKNYYMESDDTSKCIKCPSFGNIEAVTSGAYNNAITTCYVPKDSTDSDEFGTFKITENCKYTE